MEYNLTIDLSSSALDAILCIRMISRYLIMIRELWRQLLYIFYMIVIVCLRYHRTDLLLLISRRLPTPRRTDTLQLDLLGYGRIVKQSRFCHIYSSLFSETCSLSLLQLISINPNSLFTFTISY